MEELPIHQQNEEIRNEVDRIFLQSDLIAHEIMRKIVEIVREGS